MPKDERLFVDHILRWIAHHDKLYNYRISCEVLIEATEASILSVTGNQNKRFYNGDTLREIYGYLIDISSEDALDFIRKSHYIYISMSFAHYSVREYLNMKRTLDINLNYYTIDREDLNNHFLEITLSKAQRIESNEI